MSIDDDLGHGMGIVVQYAGHQGKPQWVATILLAYRLRRRAAPIHKKPLAGRAARGAKVLCLKTNYGRASNFFQADSRLLAFTEPRPLAKLQPALAANAEVVLLYLVVLVEVSPTWVGPKNSRKFAIVP
jgi:hypothetical protein